MTPLNRIAIFPALLVVCHCQKTMDTSLSQQAVPESLPAVHFEETCDPNYRAFSSDQPSFCFPSAIESGMPYLCRDSRFQLEWFVFSKTPLYKLFVVVGSNMDNLDIPIPETASGFYRYRFQYPLRLQPGIRNIINIGARDAHNETTTFEAKLFLESGKTRVVVFHPGPFEHPGTQGPNDPTFYFLNPNDTKAAFKSFQNELSPNNPGDTLVIHLSCHARLGADGREILLAPEAHSLRSLIDFFNDEANFVKKVLILNVLASKAERKAIEENAAHTEIPFALAGVLVTDQPEVWQQRAFFGRRQYGMGSLKATLYVQKGSLQKREVIYRPMAATRVVSLPDEKPFILLSPRQLKAIGIKPYRKSDFGFQDLRDNRIYLFKKKGPTWGQRIGAGVTRIAGVALAYEAAKQKTKGGHTLGKVRINADPNELLRISDMAAKAIVNSKRSYEIAVYEKVKNQWNAVTSPKDAQKQQAASLYARHGRPREDSGNPFPQPDIAPTSLLARNELGRHGIDVKTLLDKHNLFIVLSPVD